MQKSTENVTKSSKFCTLAGKRGNTSVSTLAKDNWALLSLTYKVLTTTQPSYLHNLITVQPPRSTRSSTLVTPARPSTSFSLRITDRSFQFVSGINSRLPSVNHALISPILPHPVVWVALAPSVPSTRHSHHPSPLHSFTPGLKLLFCKSFPP